MKYIDMHCDTISRLYDRKKEGSTETLKNSEGHVDLVRMKAGECLAQSFALFTNLKKRNDPYGHCMALCDLFEAELQKNPDLIRQVRTAEDILENEKNGRMSAVLTIEEGAVCKGEPDILKQFFEKGVRMMTLTWNYENDLAFPNRLDPDTGRTVPETERGLKKKGLEMIGLMEELGIVIDVSHLGDAGFWEVVRNTKTPFAASHSNARAVASHTRNMTDEMIKALSERGGVMGINFSAVFLNDSERNRETGRSRVEDMVTHIRHIRDVGGIECIGLGSDFDGIGNGLEIGSPALLWKLEQALGKCGFTETEIEKIFYGNALRLYGDVWKSFT